MKHLILALILLFTVSNGFAQKRTVKKKLSLTESIFYIKCVKSGKYLDLPGVGNAAAKGNGTNIQLWDIDSGNDRKFKFQSAGSGYYYILPQHCKSRLDVEGCFPDRWFCEYYKNKKGAPIQIWEFNGSSAHDVGKWKMEQVNPGQFMLVNKYSGKALDAAGDANKNGCRVVIWDAHRGSNQQWELIDVKTGQRYEL